jgi:hypothetical protein
MVYTAPLIDAEGVHRGWMSSVVDITAQKQAEARQRDQELRCSARGWPAWARWPPRWRTN